MKRVASALLMSLLLTPLMLHAAKPQSPLQLNISPARVGLIPADIKPGDAVELMISAQTFADTSKLKINVELHGGAELLSGVTSWTGAANKGDGKVMLITVRAPRHGNGWVKALMSMSPSAGASFATEAEYHFGQHALKKPVPLAVKKKDSKGREIMEHRVD